MIEKKFIEDAKIKAMLADFIKQELKRAGVSKVEIQRTPLITRIVVYVRRPGMVIGKKGRSIRELTECIAKEFKVENPRIDVKQVEVPELDPVLMAERIARMLERGAKPRRAAYSTLHAIMSAGAIGAEIRIKGKLAGKGARAKKLRVEAGYMPKAGQPSHELVREAFTVALPKPGIIGIWVRIVPPGVILPDKINVEEIAKQEAVGG